MAASFVAGGITTGIVAALAAGALMVGIRRLPDKHWMRLAVGYAMLTCVLVYLANDDPSVRQPPRIEPVAPSFPGAKESYAILMRYGKQQPLGREFQFRPSPELQQGQGKWNPGDPGWTAWLTANRAELESGWAKLEPVRTWWAELNAFDRIGDLTPPRTDADIVAFQPVRTLYQHACAIASLHALDGNETAAMETLLPILELSRKLQPSSRTLVRSMLVIAAQKMAIETAAFVLDTTTLSPGARARLASALIGGIAAEPGARRLVSVEYEFATVVLNDPGVQQFSLGLEGPLWVRHCLRPLAPIILNPRRTLNLYGDLTLELQNRAVSRDAGDIDAEAAKFIELPRVHFKNFGGHVVLSWLTPSYKNVLENYWKTEDLRSALLERLQA